MRIVSWNVNGLRAAHKKGFLDWLHKEKNTIVGLQEIRATKEQLVNELINCGNYHSYFSSAEKKGYSGTGLYSVRKPDNISTSFGYEKFDSEGRVQIAWFGRLLLVNVYFPNGSGRNRDNSRIPFKLEFYKALFSFLANEKEKGTRILVMGDYNTAHEEIDLARPKNNQKTSGFCKEERLEFSSLLAVGWIDTFRHYHKTRIAYSWWSNRKGVRERNIGWRIDYILATKSVLPFIKDAFIDAHVFGSDHCPVGITVSPDIFA